MKNQIYPYGSVRVAKLFGAALSKIQLEGELRFEPIAEETTFLDWLDAISQDRIDPSTGKEIKGLRIDGRRFDLSQRPAMQAIYEQMPSTREEASGKRLTLMKCSQVGFTVMEMLWAIFFALKYEPLHLGFFLPDAALARAKSTNRFLPIIRTIPAAYQRMVAPNALAMRRQRSEGNVMTRWLGASLLYFLWTSGRATTESNPMDVVSFDEVQEMLISHMEKVLERLSASDLKFVLMGSTANWPEADIHHWYLQGTQHRFHTRCPTCEREEPLDEYFPDCVGFDEDHPDAVSGLLGAYRYCCREGHWIDDPQNGAWKAGNPEPDARRHLSYHFHQMLSPTVTPREIIEAWLKGDDRKNFFNRKLGKPYQDPSQVPITLAHLNKCAEVGMAAGVVWKTQSSEAYMGVDQMGAYNVVVIKERLDDGRQAVVHVEEIFDADPFARCDELIKQYGIQACVVEALPNFNDAHRFASRWPALVFLAHYGELAGEAIRWGDGPKLDASERRTVEEERTRFTVTLDQYKCMSRSLARFVHTDCLFPDPQGLTQDVLDKGVLRRVAVLKDRAFVHFQKTALVTERVNEAERKLRRRVVKVGIDPHFSFANMLCDVACSRAHGTATFILPGADERQPGPAIPAEMQMQAAPATLLEHFASSTLGEVCGSCVECPTGQGDRPGGFFCKVGNFKTQVELPACAAYVAA